jgi:PadR family transcriptional regulator, regulatory protein PadR
MSNTRRQPIAGLQECPCTGRNLDKLIQPAVLALLAEEPMHGYRLVQRLGRMPMFKGHRPDTTGVYRFLKAMEDRGLVSSAWDLSDSGPAKRLFNLTVKGHRCLVLWGTTLQEYHEQIAGLLETIRAATGSVAAKRCACRGQSKVARRAGRC